jgi:hypothetical protein
MKTTHELPRNIVVGGFITAITLAFALALQRKRKIASSADSLMSACECALQKLGERADSIPA